MVKLIVFLLTLKQPSYNFTVKFRNKLKQYKFRKEKT